MKLIKVAWSIFHYYERLPHLRISGSSTLGVCLENNVQKIKNTIFRSMLSHLPLERFLNESKFLQGKPGKWMKVSLGQWKINKKEPILLSLGHFLVSLGLPIGCFQYRPKESAESVLLHKNSNKSSNILLNKPLSAPSVGCYWKQLII